MIDFVFHFYFTAGRKFGLHNTEGVKTLGLGKGLFMSNHVRGMACHGINPNISYCFVLAKVRQLSFFTILLCIVCLQVLMEHTLICKLFWFVECDSQAT